MLMRLRDLYSKPLVLTSIRELQDVIHKCQGKDPQTIAPVMLTVRIAYIAIPGTGFLWGA